MGGAHVKEERHFNSFDFSVIHRYQLILPVLPVWVMGFVSPNEGAQPPGPLDSNVYHIIYVCELLTMRDLWFGRLVVSRVVGRTPWYESETRKSGNSPHRQ